MYHPQSLGASCHSSLEGTGSETVRKERYPWEQGGDEYFSPPLQHYQHWAGKVKTYPAFLTLVQKVGDWQKHMKIILKQKSLLYFKHMVFLNSFPLALQYMEGLLDSANTLRIYFNFCKYIALFLGDIPEASSRSPCSVGILPTQSSIENIFCSDFHPKIRSIG